MTKNPNRRHVLAGLGAGAGTLNISAANGQNSTPDASPTPAIRPTRLRKNDLVEIVAPASVTYDPDEVMVAQETLQALGLSVRVGAHVLDRYGYLAGSDEARASDINNAFADRDVRGVIALRGGWGAARLLPYIDFDTIGANPKILMGYSDITTLLNAVSHRTGLVSFHGPNANTQWDEFTTRHVRDLLFNSKAPVIQNPVEKNGYLTNHQNRIQTINQGIASGPLLGGNLTLFSGLLGTPWFPDVRGAVIFLEEVGEHIYRCDRLLNQLALAGVFDQAAAIVLGGFTECSVDPSGGLGTFSLQDIFNQHFKSLGKPVFSGAMFGHVPRKTTIPVGAMATIDADKGTMTLNQSATI